MEKGLVAKLGRAQTRGQVQPIVADLCHSTSVASLTLTPVEIRIELRIEISVTSPGFL